MSDATDEFSEARFTQPTAMCPHPERWTSRDIDSTEHQVAEMVYGLVRGLQPELCLETGTGFGVVAVQIASALKENGHGRLVTIEADPARAEKCRALWELDEPHATVIHGGSLSWLPDVDDVIEFAWFDSYYELRVPEFRHYRRWMRKGTIVCFHDTAPGHGSNGLGSMDIRATITRQLERELRLIHLPTPRGLTIGEVR